MATEIRDSNGNERVQCLECAKRGRKAYFHRLDVHLHTKHKMKAEDYRAFHPGAPTISESASRNAGAKKKTAAATGLPPKSASAPKAEPKAAAPSSFRFKSGIELKMRDPSTLTDYDRAFVPDHDANWEIGDAEMEKWEMMAVAIASRENVLDVGPTGCGKSASIQQLAAVLNQPLRRVNLDGDSRVADFVGEKTVDVDAETKQSVVRWIDGVLTDAMRRGHWLLLDEMDACPPAILFVLQAVLEKNGRLVLKANGGEVVTPHPDFRIFATANTLGRGDETGLYVGTNVLNEAFLDRFGVVLESTYPAPENERKILVEKAGVDAPTAERMVAVARKVRESLANEDCFCTFSTRRLIAWASKAAMLKNARAAARITVLNKLGREDRKFVGDLIQRYFGGEV